MSNVCFPLWNRNQFYNIQRLLKLNKPHRDDQITIMPKSHLSRVNWKITSLCSVKHILQAFPKHYCRLKYIFAVSTFCIFFGKTINIILVVVAVYFCSVGDPAHSSQASGRRPLWILGVRSTVRLKTKHDRLRTWKYKPFFFIPTCLLVKLCPSGVSGGRAGVHRHLEFKRRNFTIEASSYTQWLFFISSELKNSLQAFATVHVFSIPREQEYLHRVTK